MKKDAEVVMIICHLLTYSVNKKRGSLCFVPYSCDQAPSKSIREERVHFGLQFGAPIPHGGEVMAGGD